MIYDIDNEIFHVDFLMAAVNALLWIRCIIFLRLSEMFGPIIVMIYNMAKLVASFMVIYLMGLLTFACVAVMTMHEDPNFSDLYESIRTYMMASLGNFDLYQYDEIEEISGWKQYFGILLHLTVIFFNMILMINLFIAMMSSTYIVLEGLRAGLFWASVI